MLPFQEGQFESSPVLWNRQRRSREGEKMLLLNKIRLTFVILVHTYIFTSSIEKYNQIFMQA